MITLERLRYWQGQLLKSRDFRDQLRYQAHLRARHNAALHQAFGIVSGLEIKDGRVTCGFGYDCLGRELILPNDTPLPPRTAAGAQLLVVLPVTPGAASTLAWIDELAWSGKRGLPLARVAGSAEAFDNAYGRAPYVRALSRPRLASGETVRGNTPWELWNEGAIPVGVQTHVDTSAAGFTQKPRYFASLKARQWSLNSRQGKEAAEFAPAYFANVTDATNDGFTFRLLLQDVALRRYESKSVVARITSLDRGAGEMVAQVAPGSLILKGNAVVQVRPRTETAAMVKDADAATLTLTTTLDLATDDRVVLGNLPRTAIVEQVTEESETFVLLSNMTGVVAGTILAHFDADASKGRASRVARIKNSKLLLRDDWPGLAPTETVNIFQRKDAEKLTDAETAGDNTVITVPSDSALKSGDFIVHLTGKAPGPPAKVMGVVTTATAIKLTLQPPIAELKAGSSVVPSRVQVTVSTVDTPAGSLEILLTEDSPFVEGDYLKPAGGSSAAAVVDFSDGAVVRLRVPKGWAAEGDTLVAGNLAGALIVENVRTDPAGGAVVQVARPGAVRSGYAVARLDNDTTLSTHATVTKLPGSEFRIDPPIAGLGRLQTLVVIQFPAVVRVAAILSASRIQIDPADAVAPGDWLAPLGAAAAFPLVQAVTVEPDGSVTFSRAIDVPVDSLLGQAHFRDSVVLKNVDAGKKQVETREVLEVTRDWDFIGRWAYYEDNSSAAVVANVAGNRLTLKPVDANTIPGEGLIKSGPFDAGLLAYASVTPQQKGLVLKDTPGLRLGDAVTLSGPNSIGATITVPMTVAAADQTRLDLAPTLGIAYSLRPERSMLVSKYNDNFPTSFAVFAQRQGLYVAWLGCQDESRTYPKCSDGPTEDPCP